MSNLGYTSKEERKIPINDPSGKWSDLTHLPEWNEPYYDVYTVKKYGKWIMCKGLKKEYADKREYQEMLEREFDVRYNLAHPNIVMCNDLEMVPGVGMAIITDDTYGYSLRRLIDEKRLTPQIIHRLQTQLLDVMEYIQENHLAHDPITPENIIFTEYNENLKLLNVGHGIKKNLSPLDTTEDIRSYGAILNEVLDRLPTTLPHLRKIARKCEESPESFSTIADLHLEIERRSSAHIYIMICVFILIMASVLFWLSRVG